MTAERVNGEIFTGVTDYSLDYLRWGTGMCRDTALLRALGGVALIGLGMATDGSVAGVGACLVLRGIKEFRDLSRYLQDIKEEELVRLNY